MNAKVTGSGAAHVVVVFPQPVVEATTSLPRVVLATCKRKPVHNIAATWYKTFLVFLIAANYPFIAAVYNMAEFGKLIGRGKKQRLQRHALPPFSDYVKCGVDKE